MLLPILFILLLIGIATFAYYTDPCYFHYKNSVLKQLMEYEHWPVINSLLFYGGSLLAIAIILHIAGVK